MLRPGITRKIVTVAISAVMFAITAAPAGALTIVANERVDAERAFAGPGCNTTDTTTLRTQAGAFDVLIGGIPVGTVLTDVVDDVPVATLVGAQISLEPDGRWLGRWTVRSGYAACQPGQPAYLYGWATYDQPLALTWRRQIPVVLEPWRARGLLSGALRSRLRLGGPVRGVRCSRVREREARCRFRFLRHETLYEGTARVWLGANRERTEMRWSYRWRLSVTDQHCVELRGRPLKACRRVKSLARRNLRLEPRPPAAR